VNQKIERLNHMFNIPKFPLFVFLGVVFWFSAMLFVRIAHTAIFTPSNPLLIIAFVLAFPILWVAVKFSQIISGVPMKDMFEPVVLMTIIAMFLDGLGIAWVPGLYGTDSTAIMLGAAWILWGAAAGILIAKIESKRANATQAV
jgi:hypothetical protein